MFTRSLSLSLVRPFFLSPCTSARSAGKIEEEGKKNKLIERASWQLGRTKVKHRALKAHLTSGEILSLIGDCWESPEL